MKSGGLIDINKESYLKDYPNIVEKKTGQVLTEDPLVVDLFDDEPGAGGEGTDEDVQVEEERHPGGGLMLRYRRDDGNVNFGVSCIP